MTSDTRPRLLTDEEFAARCDLAHFVVGELEVWLPRRRYVPCSPLPGAHGADSGQRAVRMGHLVVQPFVSRALWGSLLAVVDCRPGGDVWPPSDFVDFVPIREVARHVHVDLSGRVHAEDLGSVRQQLHPHRAGGVALRLAELVDELVESMSCPF